MNFILIDRVLKLEPGRRIVVSKTFSPAEPFFKDHFPGVPIVPGTLLAEIMIQAGGWLILDAIQYTQWPFLCMIESAKFRSFVRPGQELLIEATLRDARATDFQVEAKACVENKSVAESNIFYHSADSNGQPFADSENLKSWAQRTFLRLSKPDEPSASFEKFTTGTQRTQGDF